jgi:hypothetical protein
VNGGQLTPFDQTLDGSRMDVQQRGYLLGCEERGRGAWLRWLRLWATGSDRTGWRRRPHFLGSILGAALARIDIVEERKLTRLKRGLHEERVTYQTRDSRSTRR